MASTVPETITIIIDWSPPLKISHVNEKLIFIQKSIGNDITSRKQIHQQAKELRCNTIITEQEEHRQVSIKLYQVVVVS